MLSFVHRVFFLSTFTYMKEFLLLCDCAIFRLLLLFGVCFLSIKLVLFCYCVCSSKWSFCVLLVLIDTRSKLSFLVISQKVINSRKAGHVLRQYFSSSRRKVLWTIAKNELIILTISLVSPPSALITHVFRIYYFLCFVHWEQAEFCICAALF